MRSNRSRIALAVGALAVIVILFVVLSGGSNNNDKSRNGGPARGSTAQAGSSASGGAPAVINVIDGKPAGGIQKLNYTKGDQVRFTVNSDIGDEIHVHGYDLQQGRERRRLGELQLPGEDRRRLRDRTRSQGRADR